MQKCLFLFFLLIGGLSCADTTAQSNVIDPTVFEAKLRSDSTIQLVDVRTPEEFDEGHIEGAINYNFNGADFVANLDKLDKNKPVLVYCAAGGRSAKAASLFKKKGFTQVFDLKGGMNAWLDANKKAVK